MLNQNWISRHPQASRKRQRQGLFNQDYRALIGKEDMTDDLISLPPVNVEEKKGNYILHLAAPGFKKEDFQVSITNGQLIISAKSTSGETSDEESNSWHQKEFSFHSFQRSFTLPENVDDENINAKYENGMLILSIPRFPQPETEAMVKKIQVF